MSGKFNPTLVVVSKRFLFASAAILALCWLGERRAEAQPRFGDKHQLVIGAENLFSISTERFATSPPGGDRSEVSSRFGFLYTGQREQGMVTPLGPQVSGHYFIIPSLSLGGTIGYEVRGGSTTTPVGNTGAMITTSQADESTFLFLPKVGYVLGLNDVIGFWFRGGLGFARVAASAAGNNGSVSDTFWLFSADALFTVVPFPHFGFYVGPQANLSFAGSNTATAANGTETSVSASFRSIAISMGIFGYLDL
jgi:hypothetical protein